MRLEDREIRACLSASIMEGIQLVDGPQNDTFHANVVASGLTEEELTDHLDLLCTILEKTFGTGSFTVRRAIAKEFYSKLGLPFEAYLGKKLSGYVADAEQRLKTKPATNLG
ncbi:MAG TPA: hypothetical protein VLV18_01925 [Terriglobales bacterium]|nr:hypothetical protein [Terriglobales bacterium]